MTTLTAGQSDWLGRGPTNTAAWRGPRKNNRHPKTERTVNPKNVTKIKEKKKKGRLERPESRGSTWHKHGNQ